MKLNYLFISAAFITMACSGPKWSYEGKNGAENWGNLSKSFHVCEAGKVQSPIDIKKTVSKNIPNVVFSYNKFSPEILNDGHTIQVNVPAGQAIKVGNDSYKLLQFHFHTPSEYHINSKSYPLEVHFVHQNADGVLAVVGVMFKEGKANQELDKILKNMPSKAGKTNKDNLPALDITKLLPKDQRSYSFDGSLTTPPCSEGVKWYVMQNAITASKEQISEFRKLYPMNARPIQPANGRVVIKDSK